VLPGFFVDEILMQDQKLFQLGREVYPAGSPIGGEGGKTQLDHDKPGGNARLFFVLFFTPKKSTQRRAAADHFRVPVSSAARALQLSPKKDLPAAGRGRPSDSNAYLPCEILIDIVRVNKVICYFTGLAY